jgi:hypothetical protein
VVSGHANRNILKLAIGCYLQVREREAAFQFFVVARRADERDDDVRCEEEEEEEEEEGK